MISAGLRKHAQRIKAECGWMSGGPPDTVRDLEIAADTLDRLERLLAEANEKLRARGIV